MLKSNNLQSGQVIGVQSPGSDMGTTTIDIAVLVALIQSKSETAFDVLYDKYAAALYGILVKLVRRSDVADDLLQDTFVKIWNHIGSFDAEKGTLFTWMLNIARNLAIDYLRSSGYRQQLQQVDISICSLEIDCFGITASGMSDLEFEDFKSKGLQQLEPKYAEVIDMIFFYGYTHEQTALILNLPLGTVKTRIRRGLTMLKPLFEE